MISKELEELIRLTLVDGKLTEQERAVIVRKALEEGIDLETINVILDSKLEERLREMSATGAQGGVPSGLVGGNSNNKKYLIGALVGVGLLAIFAYNKSGRDDDSYSERVDTVYVSTPTEEVAEEETVDIDTVESIDSYSSIDDSNSSASDDDSYSSDDDYSSGSDYSNDYDDSGYDDDYDDSDFDDDYTGGSSHSSDDPNSLKSKAKAAAKKAASQAKEKYHQMKESDTYQKAKEKAHDAKEKAKEKIGQWLDNYLDN